MIKYIIISISVILLGCNISKTSLSSNNESGEADVKSEKINEFSEISILNRIRSIPGLKINGSDENTAEIYITGITSVMFTQEVTFYVNGMRVGTFSQLINLIKPNEIKSMRLLKGTSAANIYGEEGTWGVILIKTK